jgi:hypothetical protein
MSWKCGGGERGRYRPQGGASLANLRDDWGKSIPIANQVATPNDRAAKMILWSKLPGNPRADPAGSVVIKIPTANEMIASHW